MPSQLTIGVPTYNRAYHVVKLIDYMLAIDIVNSINILVIDDGSKDNTFDILTKKTLHSLGIRILKNHVNEGYAKTFCRIFKECKTPYLMVTADDDDIIVENIIHLVKFLDREKPDFVSPQCINTEGNLLRGSKITTPIKPYDFFGASAHAPGLVYRVAACNEAIALLRSRIDTSSSESLVYPQIVIVIHLLSSNAKCLWLALPSVLEGASVPSGIFDASGNSYCSLESRWKQLKDFEDLLANLLSENNCQAIHTMIKANRDRVFWHLVTALQNDRPALRIAFDMQARKYYVKQILKMAFKFLFKN